LKRLGVPTLDELVELARNHPDPVTLFIETKHYPNTTYNFDVERMVTAALKRHRLIQPSPADHLRVAVHSFHPDGLRRLHRLAPNLPTVLLAPRLPSLAAVSQYLAVAKWARANAISFYQTLRAYPEAVDLAHRQGLNVWAGVVHDPIEARYLADLGV